MAKLFKFFDPTKEGKGVKKDEPKKKSFFAFFEIYFLYFWKLLLAGLMYLPFYLTVIPSGLGHVGLTYIARGASLRKHTFLVSDFFDTIKKNWKQALPVGIINALFTALIIFDFFFFLGQKNPDLLSGIGMGVAVFIYVVFCSMKYYIWLLMITFDFKITRLYKNAFHLTFINLWKNLFMELVLAVLYAIPFLLWLIGLPDQLMIILYVAGGLFFFPGFKALLINANAFPCIKKVMIDPYYEKHPDADIDKRRALGLIEEERSEEDSIFVDRG